ncbi:hypothetical protein AAF712_011059 [Marasmius tenuissimus]|uniref:Uncharacterized protein n=1 Tax=Marasmius tenuissimus TaxID=585030 RepID=A0ABR2ZLI2_9AGAR
MAGTRTRGNNKTVKGAAPKHRVTLKVSDPKKATKASKGRKKKGKDGESDANEVSDEPERKKRAMLINWNKEPHSLTERLLTSITDSPAQCEAFSFLCPPGTSSNNSQGKTNETHWRDLAQFVFFADGLPPAWKDQSCTVADLWKLCKNQVGFLKKTFI